MRNLSYSVVLLFGIGLLSCAEQSTSVNGTSNTLSISRPKLRTCFSCSFHGHSIRTLPRTFGFYQDTVVLSDSTAQQSSLIFRSTDLETSTSHFESQLTFSPGFLRYSNSRLLNHLSGGGDDNPPITLPLADREYSDVHDTSIDLNGFHLGSGVYSEVAQNIGDSTATVAGHLYQVWQFRSVRSMFDTLSSLPQSQLDTIEAVFAPELGYFTYLREIRYQYWVGGSDAIEIESTLDSVAIP